MKKTIVYAVVLVGLSVLAGLAIGLTVAHKPRNMRGLGIERKYHSGGSDEIRVRGRKAEIFEHLSRRLDLSENQKAEVKEILEASRRQVKGVSNVARESLTKIKEETNAKIRAILSTKQQEEFDRMIAELKDRIGKIGDRQSGPRPGPQPEGRKPGFLED
jgi:Spy/CpxP family protein refolding chaperone